MRCVTASEWRSGADGRNPRAPDGAASCRERDFFIDNLLVRIHFIIVMIRWTGLAPWEFVFTFPGSLTSTFLVGRNPRAPDGAASCTNGTYKTVRTGM